MNAVIYARFSCGKQHETSIDDQLRECLSYAQAHGYIIVGEYTDYATSARTDNRPQFQKMIGDSEKKVFDTVLVYKTDRFARNKWDSVIYKKKLKMNGVTVKPVAESIPDGPMGVMVESIYESMAEMYSENLSENVRRGMEGNALACRANNAPPRGYIIGPDRKYAIDENYAPMIREMFKMVASGQSIPSVIKYCKIFGLNLAYSTVYKMLHNEKYKGVYIFGNHRVEGGVPAIISDELFVQVQEQLQSHKHYNKPAYLLAKKIYCADCGTLCRGISGTSHTGEHYYYYKCAKHKAIPASAIEEAVMGTIMDFLSEDKNIRAIVQKVVEKSKEYYKINSNVPQLERRLQSINRAIANYYKLMEEQDLISETTRRLKKKLEEKAEVEKALAKERIAAPVINAGQIASYLHKLSNEKHKQRLINMFLYRVYVCADHIVIIHTTKKEHSLTFDEVKKVFLESDAGTPIGLYENQVYIVIKRKWLTLR